MPACDPELVHSNPRLSQLRTRGPRRICGEGRPSWEYGSNTGPGSRHSGIINKCRCRYSRCSTRPLYLLLHTHLQQRASTMAAPTTPTIVNTISITGTPKSKSSWEWWFYKNTKSYKHCSACIETSTLMTQTK